MTDLELLHGNSERSSWKRRLLWKQKENWKQVSQDLRHRGEWRNARVKIPNQLFKKNDNSAKLLNCIHVIYISDNQKLEPQALEGTKKSWSFWMTSKLFERLIQKPSFDPKMWNRSSYTKWGTDAVPDEYTEGVSEKWELMFVGQK